MEQPKQQDLINFAKNNVKIKLSCFGYLSRCQYAIYNIKSTRFEHENESIEKIKDGDSIFVHCGVDNLMDLLITLCERLLEKNIKVKWYVLSEPDTHQMIISLISNCAYDIYLTNNTYNIQNIHTFPIGIREGEETHPVDCAGFSQKYILDELKQSRERNILCLLCFSNTHYERQRCEEILGNMNFIYNLNKEQFPIPKSTLCGKVPVTINYQKTHESKYVLSPRGYGEATHRFYEALILRSIPIVKRTNGPMDKVYSVFPCLIVDDWNEVTEALLEEKYPKLKAEMETFWERHPNWYENIDCIDSLLIRT